MQYQIHELFITGVNLAADSHAPLNSYNSKNTCCMGIKIIPIERKKLVHSI